MQTSRKLAVLSEVLNDDEFKEYGWVREKRCQKFGKDSFSGWTPGEQ